MKENKDNRNTLSRVLGRTDIIAYCSKNNGKVYNVDGVFDFSGSLVVHSTIGDETVTYTNDAYINEGTKADRRVTGTVEDFTKELTDKNYITVSFLSGELSPEELAGEYIYINRYESAIFNACYKIISAEKRDDGKFDLFIGDVSPVETRSLSSQTKNGYTYSIVKKQNFYIPLTNTEGDPEKLYGAVYEGDESTGGTGEGPQTPDDAGGSVIWIIVVAAVVLAAAGAVVGVTGAKKKQDKK